jgi:mono/diheme cytochrome c family protein
MELHWDGNNTDMTERNKSAAFGTGTTPPTIDMRASGGWRSGSSTPSRRPSALFPVDAALAARGAPIYKEYCAACHGASGGTSAASTWAA